MDIAALDSPAGSACDHIQKIGDRHKQPALLLSSDSVEPRHVSWLNVNIN